MKTWMWFMLGMFGGSAFGFLLGAWLKELAIEERERERIRNRWAKFYDYSEGGPR